MEFIIVLGEKLKNNGNLNRNLKYRLDKAKKYILIKI